MTTTDPTAPATPGEPLDLDAIEARADHYRRLCHQTGNSHAPDVVKAAHACADDVPPLLDELREFDDLTDAVAWDALDQPSLAGLARCDTCSDTGWCKQEGQIGVPGSGCTHGCPDCEVGRSRLARGELLEPDERDDLAPPTTGGPDHDGLTGAPLTAEAAGAISVAASIRDAQGGAPTANLATASRGLAMPPIPPLDLTDDEREAFAAAVEGREPEPAGAAFKGTDDNLNAEGVSESAAIDAAHIERQRRFSADTFGPGLRLGVIDHIRKELTEVEADPTDLAEWVDVIILGFDGAWRAGHEPQAIIDAIKAKQARNEARTWPDWRTADRDKAIEHDRSAIEHDRSAEPAPEPASDGPGWSRATIVAFIETVPDDEVRPQLRALLAHFDRMNALTDQQLKQAEGYVRRAEDRAEAAEAELAEVRAQLETERARWGHYKRHYLGGLDIAQRLRAHLDRLRADHLLIPKDRLKGYRVHVGEGSYDLHHPADVEIVLRGDLGQEGDRA